MTDKLASEEELAELGRKLGWDYARYGLRPPDGAPAIVLGEYKAGATKFGALTRKHDRFVRKWLQLRASAMRRSRIVSPDVDIDYLKKIDVEICPITLVKLTHGERTDSDWSVDRLNNAGAYAPGNLAVMSTKANSAKGTRSFEVVRQFAEGSDQIDGLAPGEWLRLACIMYGACLSTGHAREEALPLATQLPPWTFRPSWFSLQMVILDACSNARLRNDVLRNLGAVYPGNPRSEHLKLAAEALAERIKRVKYRYDAMVDERVQSRIKGWLNSVPEDRLPRLSALLRALTGGSGVPERTISAFSTSTGGYVRRRRKRPLHGR